MFRTFARDFVTDPKRRAIVKSITYRFTGILMMIFVGMMFGLDSIKLTVSVLVYHAIRMVQYYYHERLWDWIKEVILDGV